jgi:hypothetical protein
VLKSNDKKRARVEAMRYVLSRFEYADKDTEIVGEVWPPMSIPSAAAGLPTARTMPAMLFMVVERFRDRGAKAVYERARERGR